MLVQRVSRIRSGLLPHAGPLTIINARYYGMQADAQIPIPKRKKVWDSVDEAVRDVKSGDVLLCGGQ
jgi:3-oxoacid CoA-transferase